MRDPGLLPDGKEGELYRTDAHGSTALGYSQVGDSAAAMLWDEPHGVRALADVLTSAGADMDGWQIGQAVGISDDGTIIGGTGRNPQGKPEPWLARLR